MTDLHQVAWYDRAMNTISNLNDWRSQIDDIDTQIVNLLSKRQIISKEVGQYKHANSLSISDPAREAELMQRLSQLADSEGIESQLITEVYKSILDASKRVQAAPQAVPVQS